MGITVPDDTASTTEADLAPVLAGVRRLISLGDAAQDTDVVLGALARELMSVIGADEVHIHQLASVGEQELVVVYLLEGDGRLSYLQAPDERPPGVSWAASTGRSFLAVGPRELMASVPRLALTAPASNGALGSALLAPLVLGGQVEAVAVLVRRSGDAFTERTVEEAVTLVDQAGIALALVHARAEAGTDSVAGCLNHRAMRRRLHEEIARARRSGGRLSCLIVDLDDFKLVNDRYGHQAGDSVLRQTAQTLMGEFRAFDRVARYGGDEFVVILPDADLDSAVAAAGRALERLRKVSFPDDSRGVSASMGVAEWQPPMSTDELLEVCDAALLQGKRDGKGSVTGARSREPAQPPRPVA